MYVLIRVAGDIPLGSHGGFSAPANGFYASGGLKNVVTGDVEVLHYCTP